MALGASAELLINWRTFLDRAVVLEVATWLASAVRDLVDQRDDS